VAAVVGGADADAGQEVGVGELPAEGVRAGVDGAGGAGALRGGGADGGGVGVLGGGVGHQGGSGRLGIMGGWMRGKEVGERKWVLRLGLVVDMWVLTTVLSLAVPVWFEC